jgi:hypothetical protein
MEIWSVAPEVSMKKTMSVAVIGLLVMVALVTLESAAVAQQPSGYNINIPFSFSIGDRTFSAGEYWVGTIRPGVVYLKGVDNTNYGTMVTSFISDPRNKALNAKLVFHQYGKKYFLAQVWFLGLSTGGQLEQSKAEVEYAKVTPKTDTVLTAGN